MHESNTGVLDDAVDAGARVEATASLPLLVLPADGLADEAMLRAAEELDPAAVVLSDASVVGSNQPLLGGKKSAPVVQLSSATSGGGPGPDPRDTSVQMRQRALAETWVQAATAADGTTRGRVRLVTATNQVQGDDPGVAAPWTRRTTLSELLSGTPTPWDGELRYPAAARRAEQTPGQQASLRRLARSWSTYREALVDGDAVAAAGQASVARAASTSWRGEERLLQSFVQAQQEALDTTVKGQLRISTNPRVSTVAQDGVVFPITVENDLPVDPDDPDAGAVQLRLVFVSENRQRLRIDPIELGELRDGRRTIRAGENYTATAQVSARANGTVAVRAELQTLKGTPVGRPQRIDVRVTQNGTTGWAIAAGALVVFSGSTALRIRQVNRSRSRTAAAGDAGGATAPSALTSAPPPDAPPASRPYPHGRP